MVLPLLLLESAVEVEDAVGKTLSVLTLPVEPRDGALDDCWLEERGTIVLLPLLLVVDCAFDGDEDAVGLTDSVAGWPVDATKVEVEGD